MIFNPGQIKYGADVANMYSLSVSWGLQVTDTRRFSVGTELGALFTTNQLCCRSCAMNGVFSGAEYWGGSRKDLFLAYTS